MTPKRIQSIRARILRANRSLNVMGDMLLCLEIDAMSDGERRELQQALLNSKSPLSYGYLDSKLILNLSRITSIAASNQVQS